MGYSSLRAWVGGMARGGGLYACMTDGVAWWGVRAGTEIMQSYCPLNWDYLTRQEQCREVYGFTCCCPRCQVGGCRCMCAVCMCAVCVHAWSMCA